MLGADVPGAVLDGAFPPKPPKRLEVGAAGAVVVGAVVVGLLDVPPNKPGVEDGAVEVGGLLRPAKRLEPPVEGVVEPVVELGPPKRLPAAGADDAGCDVGVLLGKLNVGWEGLEVVAGVAATPEVAEVDEPMLLNMLFEPAGFAPNRLPEGAEELAKGDAVLAGVCVASEGLDPPNSGVCEAAAPKRLLPAGFEVLSEGGGPAGVVEKLGNAGLLGAGVVEPAGADVEALEDEFAPNGLCPAG